MRTFLTQLLREHIDRKHAVGALIKCTKTNKVLLLLRNDATPTWSCVAGGVEEGENPIETLRREIKEELSISADSFEFNKIGVEVVNKKGLNFHYYECFTSSEFLPKLDHENLKWGWFGEDDIPTPLYTGISEKLKDIWAERN